MSQVFGLDEIVRDCGLPPEAVQQILADVGREFSPESSLYELHVLRALQAEQERRMSAEERQTHQSRREQRIREHLRNRRLDPERGVYGPARPDAG